jgi:hypothetical protein
MDTIFKIATIKDNNIEKVEEYNNTDKFYSIYLDDTIDILKKKILINNKVPFESIYLYCKVNYNLDINNIYKLLTNNNKLTINKLKLIYFLKNINREDLIKNLDNKSIYNLDDFKKLDLHNKNITLNIPIGQKTNLDNNYIFSNIINPYDIDNIDIEYQSNLEDIMITNNKEILNLSLPKNSTIIDNTIYLCHIENILSFLSKKDISESIIINNYYPFLKQNNINSYNDYIENKDILLIETNKILNTTFYQYIDNIKLFYEVNQQSMRSLNYEKIGINKLSFKIVSNENSLIPIEIIFKLFNSSKSIPFIKLNLSKNMENIYRLYTDKLTNTGKKVPFLNKSLIFKLIKNIGKNRTISFYINTNSQIEFTCEIDYLGNIFVYMNELNSLDINNINIIIKQYLNPIIGNINKLLEKNGYNIKYFENIYNDNIDILDLQYIFNIEIEKNIDLNKFIACMSSIFSIESPNLKNGIIMRFKRVNYYNEMDNIEAFIIESFNKEIDKNKIVELLIDNFSLDKEEAIKKISEVISSLDVVGNLYKKKQIKLKNNPGFLTTILQEKFKNTINITIENINDLFYIKSIETYIHSLILLTQYIDDIDIDKKLINKLCSKNKVNDEVNEVKDIINKDILEESKEDIDDYETGEILFDDDRDKDDTYYNLLMGLDSDEDDDLIGGADKIEHLSLSPISKISSVSDKEDSIKLGPISDASSESTNQSSDKEDSIQLGPISDASSESTNQSSDKEDSIQLGRISDASSESTNQSSDKEDSIKLGPISDASSESTNQSSDKEDSIKLGPISDASSKSEKKLSDNESSIQLGLISDASSESEKKLSDNESSIQLGPISDASSESEKKLSDNESSIQLGPISDASSESEKKLLDKEKISLEEIGLNQLIDIEKEEKEKEKEEEEKEQEEKEKKEKEEEKEQEEKEQEEEKEEEKKKLIIIKKSKTIKKETDDKLKTIDRDITGMALANPNPFSERLEERDPKLFVINEKDGKYNAYSRQCQSNARRQPVILTDAEKEKIDREHPGSYEHAIKYGSNSDKQYWYICPRYWSLIKNTSLTEEEVNSGKYGNVIPQSSKKVPKDASIFEFTDNRVHKGKNGEYIQHYPGFILKKDSHPDGLCLPCCFKSWNTPSQKKRREECEKSINIVASDNLEKKEEVIKEELDVKMDGEGYIKSIDKFPLEPSRWGFLPIIIQKFLKTNNKECQISISNTNLKQNHICILRQGVEINNKQSFFACIASAYKVILNSQKIYTIKFIKKKILDLLNIDIFVTLQNGSLIDIFYKDSLDIDIEKYNDSKIYKNNSFFKKIVNAFENFKEYLNSDTYIDYTYLWDLICRPNEVLFKNGLNLVILELTNDDITDNVKLICPTNFYSDTKFDINKKTLILIKNGVYFEPIYTLLDSGKEYKIQRLFDLSDEKLLSNLRETLTMISDSMNKNCIVKQSLPNIYNFSKNKSLMTIIKILNNNNIKIINQVLNYNSLVIALII